MTGARVHVHADHGVHVPERITATPQSVPPEYAAGPGGREGVRRTVAASVSLPSGASSPGRRPAAGVT